MKTVLGFISSEVHDDREHRPRTFQIPSLETLITSSKCCIIHLCPHIITFEWETQHNVEPPWAWHTLCRCMCKQQKTAIIYKTFGKIKKTNAFPQASQHKIQLSTMSWTCLQSWSHMETKIRKGAPSPKQEKRGNAGREQGLDCNWTLNCKLNRNMCMHAMLLHTVQAHNTSLHVSVAM